MQIFPTGVLLFGLFLLALRRGFQPGLIAYGALIPFGAAAVFVLGPLSFVASKLAMMTLCLVWLGSYLLRPPRPMLPRPDPAVAIWLIFTAYALFTAFAYPRLFESEVLVIRQGDLKVDLNTVARLHALLPVTNLSRLVPSSSNLSQSFYFLFDVLFFYLAVTLGRQYGPALLDKVLMTAATVNAALGLIDLLALDALLTPFRTADYGIADYHVILGFDRIIGGLPEASNFADLSSWLAIYAASRYLDSGRWQWGLLGALNALLCLGAFSSTGFLAITMGLLLLILRLLKDALFGHHPAANLSRHALVLGAAFSLGAFLFLTPVIGSFLTGYLDTLIFSKTDSLSGIERGIWAREGIRVGLETFGLGAGLGSVRANGLVAVWFANLGAPGLLFFSMFLGYLFLFQREPFRDRGAHSMSRAASLSLLTALAAQFASATTISFPGLVAAIILCARARGMTPSKRDYLAQPCLAATAGNAIHDKDTPATVASGDPTRTCHSLTAFGAMRQ